MVAPVSPHVLARRAEQKKNKNFLLSVSRALERAIRFVFFSTLFKNNSRLSVSRAMLKRKRKREEEEEETSDASGEPDYYEILNLEKDASFDQVNRAFRKRSRTCHPDRNKGKQDEFHVLNDARQILTDGVRRVAYNLRKFGSSLEKWKGSEAHALEEAFYADLGTVEGENHVSKPPPIVVNYALSMEEWMRDPSVCVRGRREEEAPLYGNRSVGIAFNKFVLCVSCKGYACIPASVMETNLLWNPMEFTRPCTQCGECGFLLSETSLRTKKKAKENSSNDENESTDYYSRESQNMALTAEIQPCRLCKGKKRIYRETVDTVACSACDQTGTTYLDLFQLDNVPIPFHLDASRRNGVVVLLHEGHTLRPNCPSGDVHVHFTLRTETMFPTTLIAHEPYLPSEPIDKESSSHTSETSEDSSSSSEEYKDEELDLPEKPEVFDSFVHEEVIPPDTCVEDLIRDTSSRAYDISNVPLRVDETGWNFETQLRINLKDALSGFQCFLQHYWARVPDTEDQPPFSRIYVQRGNVVWTGDMWYIRQRGPIPCPFCEMPPILHSTLSSHSQQNFDKEHLSTLRTIGNFPGFAPCTIFSRSSDKEEADWDVHSCVVSGAVYPSYTNNIYPYVETKRRLTANDFWTGLNKSRGHLRMEITVASPIIRTPTPTLFKTIDWCCDAMRVFQVSRHERSYEMEGAGTSTCE